MSTPVSPMRLAGCLPILAVSASGCVLTRHADPRDPCSRTDAGTPFDPAAMARAYQGIDGVTVDLDRPTSALRGAFYSSNGFVSDRLTLRDDGRAISRPASDLPTLFVSMKFVGRWTAGPGQIALAMPDWQEDGSCSSTRRFDVIRVDGRTWLVRSRFRPSFRVWFAETVEPYLDEGTGPAGRPAVFETDIYTELPAD